MHDSRNTLKVHGHAKTAQKRIPSIASSCGEEQILAVYLRMREKSLPRSPVFYKNDEHRFSQQMTLKLKTFFLYDVVLEVNDNQNLVYVVLGGKTYNCFKVVENSAESTRLYTFVWSTSNIRPTKRSHRSVLPCAMKFKGYKELRFDLLVKFYYNDEDVRYSGIPLSFIDLQIGVGEQTTLNSISFE